MRATTSSNATSESELRKMDLPTLAKESRQAWERVKSEIPSDVRSRIEPHFNVLTDSGYIQNQAQVLAGTK